MDATIIIAVVPVVLLAAYIIWLVRAKITEGREIDLREPITALVICLVAVLIIGSMTASTVTYTYSEENNTLYINQNLIDSSQPFDSYGDEVKSVVIGNQCRLIETGTLDSLTALEYVSIGKNVEVRQGAFSVSFEDFLGQTIMDPEAGEYVGKGDGTLYLADDSIFKYSTDGKAITGLTADAASAKNLVIPISHNGVKIEAASNSSFTGNTSIERVMTLPGEYSFRSVGTNAFNGDTSLVEAILPDSMTALNYRAFFGCTSLETVSMPSVTTMGGGVFQGCTSLDIQLPSSLATIGNSAFANCSGLTDLYFPSTLETLESYSFNGCAGVTSVAFAPGFAPTALDSNAFRSWTFYATDGTTTIDRTDASALAGKTFQGTAAALIEVTPGQLSLTPQQLEQVQLHTQELQQQELDIQPLPFQPSLQTQEQEPASA